MKKEKEIVLICKKCGKEAKPNKKENGWKIFSNMKCKKCGSRLEFELK